MWVLFVKLLSPADWWLDPKPRLSTIPTTMAPQRSVPEPAPLAAAPMVTARDAG